jgi:hypothetical protein
MSPDELDSLPSPSTDSPEEATQRRSWQPPALTRLDVVETTLAKHGIAVDGADFDFS